MDNMPNYISKWALCNDKYVLYVLPGATVLTATLERDPIYSANAIDFKFGLLSKLFWLQASP